MSRFYCRQLFLSLVLAAGWVVPSLAQERVVSLGGDVTEIIYLLGEGDRIVATDSTSVYPEAAIKTPKVGYVRQLSAEGVLSAEPDIILISGAAGPEPALQQIRDSGVEIVIMETNYTPESILEKTRRVASALGVEAKGAALVDTISADWQRAKQEIDDMNLAPSVLFFATLREGAPRAAGKETAAHGIIEMIGGTNIFGDQNGYQSLSLEAAVAADPDIILVMKHNAERMGGIDKVKLHPAISLTTAIRTGQIFLVDEVAVMQFGPRTPSAVADLARQINDVLKSGDGS